MADVDPSSLLYAGSLLGCDLFLIGLSVMFPRLLD